MITERGWLKCILLKPTLRAWFTRMEASQLLQCIITEKQFIQINTFFDEENKKAHNSQIIWAKENLKLSQGGPIQR